MIHHKKTMTSLAIGALGVVFGDIGTSPLYALRAVFGPDGQHLAITQDNVLGIISLVIWAVTIVVSVKYIGYVMHADNDGEGGIVALIALIKRSMAKKRLVAPLVFLGLIGVSLFYGDSVITPAISVLSAVEGLNVVAPGLHDFIVPISLAILVFLFSIQRFGTGLVGRIFGPVMLTWFLTLAAGGSLQIWHQPSVLLALSPLAAVDFFINQPLIAFVAMGAVVLAITGAEALYADMGHFGRPAIKRAWFFLVFPALALCYMGQGAILLADPYSVANPFVLLFPAVVQLPVVLLATLATLIASQSVISGAFSLTRQAVQLNFLPKLLVRHTSDQEVGQIYLPFVNVVLLVIVTVIVVAFGSSEKLANAYGLAVSGTLAIDTILFVGVMRSLWHKSAGYTAALAVVLLPLDLLFVASNSSKIVSGGWLPLLIAVLVLVVITTWVRGQTIISRERKLLEGPLQSLVDSVHSGALPVARIEGQAVYVGHHTDYTPLALRTTVEQLHELHKKVVVVSVTILNVPHVAEDKRAVFDPLRYADGISHLSLSFGFHDVPNIPKTLQALRTLNAELDFDPLQASYFVSQTKVTLTRRHNMAHWRKSLFTLMARNELSSSDYFKLPTDRTVEMRSLIKL